MVSSSCPTGCSSSGFFTGSLPLRDGGPWVSPPNPHVSQSGQHTSHSSLLCWDDALSCPAASLTAPHLVLRPWKVPLPSSLTCAPRGRAGPHLTGHSVQAEAGLQAVQSVCRSCDCPLGSLTAPPPPPACRGPEGPGELPAAGPGLPAAPGAVPGPAALRLPAEAARPAGVEAAPQNVSPQVRGAGSRAPGRLR